MDPKPRRSKLSSVIPIAGLAGVLLSRFVWGRGGPDAFYWVGNILLALLLAFPGLAVLVSPATAYSWYRSAAWFNRTSRGAPSWKDAGKLHRVGFIGLAVFDLILALVILYITIVQLVSACAPTGNCPPLEQ